LFKFYRVSVIIKEASFLLYILEPFLRIETMSNEFFSLFNLSLFWKDEGKSANNYEEDTKD